MAYYDLYSLSLYLPRHFNEAILWRQVVQTDHQVWAADVPCLRVDDSTLYFHFSYDLSALGPIVVASC